MESLVLVVATLIIVLIALLVRRYADPGRLSRERYERLKELGEKLDNQNK